MGLSVFTVSWIKPRYKNLKHIMVWYGSLQKLFLLLMICTDKNNKSRNGGTFIYFASLGQKTVKFVPCWAIFHQSLQLAPAPGAFYPFFHQSIFTPTCCNLKTVAGFRIVQLICPFCLTSTQCCASMFAFNIPAVTSLSLSLLTPSPSPITDLSLGAIRSFWEWHLLSNSWNGRGQWGKWDGGTPEQSPGASSVQVRQRKITYLLKILFNIAGLWRSRQNRLETETFQTKRSYVCKILNWLQAKIEMYLVKQQHWFDFFIILKLVKRHTSMTHVEVNI